MIFDLDMIKAYYADLPGKVAAARQALGRPLTLTEKILFSHLHPESPMRDHGRGKDYVFFAPDRVAMQDATAQMALLQFMTCGMDKTAVPSTVHCDHLIQAKTGADTDLRRPRTSTPRSMHSSRPYATNMASGSGSRGPGSSTRPCSRITRFPAG